MIRRPELAFFLLACLATGMGCDSPEKDSDTIEILAISGLPNPNEVPYPNGASVCLCRTPRGEKILVTIPAFENRVVLPKFKSLEPGDKIRVKLIPWENRPARARAMAVANDFADEFELKLYFVERILSISDSAICNSERLSPFRPALT